MSKSLERLAFFAQDVAHQKVGKAACADAEEALLDVFLAEKFADDGVVGQGILHGAYAASGLEANHRARLLVIFADGLAHHVGSLRSGAYRDFAR